MAYQRLQVGRALVVIPSDTINIPNVAAVATSGTASSIPLSNRLLDTVADFSLVKVGDIVSVKIKHTDEYDMWGIRE